MSGDLGRELCVLKVAPPEPIVALGDVEMVERSLRVLDGESGIGLPAPGQAREDGFEAFLLGRFAVLEQCLVRILHRVVGPCTEDQAEAISAG